MADLKFADEREVVAKLSHIIFSDFCMYDLDKADELYDRIGCDISDAVRKSPLELVKILLEIIDNKDNALEETEKELSHCRNLIRFMSKKAGEVLERIGE